MREEYDNMNRENYERGCCHFFCYFLQCEVVNKKLYIRDRVKGEENIISNILIVSTQLIENLYARVYYHLYYYISN